MRQADQIAIPNSDSTPIKRSYAKVLLPLSIAQNYTYGVPDDMKGVVEPGKRVEVQFGKKRIYAGIVEEVFEAEPPSYAVKPILNVLDNTPILLPIHLRMWQWMSEYYMCHLGEVMNAALPAAFKLSSETKLVLNPDFNEDYSLLSDPEFLIAEALSIQKEIVIADVQAILERKQVYIVIKSLMEKGVALAQEELKERYRPKLATYLQLAPDYEDSRMMRDLFDQLERKAPRQLTILMAFLQISGSAHTKTAEKGKVLAKADATSAALKGLIKKGVFIETKERISRLDDNFDSPTIDYELTTHQTEAFAAINQFFEKKSVVLLHGVTSSGKTQLYIKLMQKVLAAGKQVLYLLPEIALTTQMIDRLRQVFGNQVGVYHSRFSTHQRIEIWQKTIDEEYKIVIGARSALFLPFADLGLVIIDEEHDASFKQMNPAPRYHARDAAIYLAALFKAKTIIGSATPAMESYFNATYTKKFGYVTLTERYGGVEAPEIQLVNLKEAIRQKKVQSHFSSYLLGEVKAALEAGEQVIIFQNRRGYAPYLMCASCTWIPQCHQCDVSLTYHKYANILKCHYCGFTRKLLSECDACKSTNMQIEGFGTEKIEDELKLFFPDAKVGRLDLETARSKKGFEKIITQFEARKFHILVGTQMITKGLDFDNVSLVGILSADQLVNFPDFRAAERALQLMLQVSGRAGRREKQGRVIIQSLNPNYPVLTYVMNQDYNSFYLNELHERHQFNYPPFVRMIRLTVKHRHKEMVNKASFQLVKDLKSKLGKRVLGPNVPLVSRVRNYYIRQILIKIDKSAVAIKEHKPFIQLTIDNLKATKAFHNPIVQVDVDPY